VASIQPEWRRSIRQTVVHVTGLVVVFLVVPVNKERWWLGIVIGLLIIVGSVPLTVREVHRCLVTRHEALVAVRGRVRDRG